MLEKSSMMKQNASTILEMRDEREKCIPQGKSNDIENLSVSLQNSFAPAITKIPLINHIASITPYISSYEFITG